MVDRYIFGQVDRISPEAPVPIVRHQRTDHKAGGAANVALNLAAWGCTTSLISLTGTDTPSSVLADLLDKNKIRHYLFRSEARPTTVKTRVVASSHHLLRIDEELVDELSDDEEQQAIQHIKACITNEKPDLIILEDYNKGFLTPAIISTVIRLGNEFGIFIAADPKEKNFFAYKDIAIFKPNFREAEQSAHRQLSFEDLSELCTEWRNNMNINTIAITLGGHGVYLQNNLEGLHVLPDQTIDVVDVCGAGDAVICALTLGILSGLRLPVMGSLANLTGAYVCSQSGVVPVNTEAITGWI
jgi:rfaE bifunctional protein kinase chain/domain